MQYKFRLPYLMLLICFSPWVLAKDGWQYIDVSIGYSKADFGASNESELFQLQVSYGQVGERYDFSVMVPYLFLRDSFGDESGLGDIMLRAGMIVIGDQLAANKLHAAIAVKLPTADETKGLGTGETDTGGFLTYTHYFNGTHFSLMGGYIVTGDSAFQTYNDIAVYGVSLARLMTPWYVYVSVDGRERIFADGEDPLELSAGFFYQIKQQQFLKVEGFTGLSDGSPDYGLTVGIVHGF